MAKENLDPTGIENKLSDLYDLSDNLLNAEAIAIRDDFMTWIDTNFNLTTEQDDYLTAMDDKFRDFLADMCYIAVKNRLNIAYEPLANVGNLRASKRLDVKNNILVSFSVTGGSSFSGELEIAASI